MLTKVKEVVQFSSAAICGIVPTKGSGDAVCSSMVKGSPMIGVALRPPLVPFADTT